MIKFFGLYLLSFVCFATFAICVLIINAVPETPLPDTWAAAGCIGLVAGLISLGKLVKHIRKLP